jgi:hypothetical protein
MKKFFLLTLIAVFFSCSTAFCAEKEAMPGLGLALKAAYMNFTDSFVKSNDIDKSIYMAVEGYAHLAPEIFLGLEVGIANPSSTVNDHKTELMYIPIELNAKYVGEFLPSWNFGIGGGLSYNYAEETVVSGGSAFNNDDWLLGGQVFAELLYASGNYFVGFSYKRQFTDNIEGSAGAVPAHRFSNWRLGGLAGVLF